MPSNHGASAYNKSRIVLLVGVHQTNRSGNMRAPLWRLQQMHCRRALGWLLALAQLW